MLRPVLKGVVEMLNQALENEGTMDAYVKCAKSQLEILVGYLGEKPPTATELQTLEETHHARTPAPPLQTGPAKEDIQYVIEIDPKDKTLKSIKTEAGKELEDYQPVKIDGVAMKYKDAIGKSMTKGGEVL